MSANPNPMGELRGVRDSCKWSTLCAIRNQQCECAISHARNFILRLRTEEKLR